MKKAINVDQIIRANQKLARYPTLIPHYNFFCGTPGETYDDLVETKKIILQIVDDNPQANLGFGFDWKPIPGSEMTEQAVRDYGLNLPENLEEWAEIDSTDAEEKIIHPWYDRKIQKYIELLQIAAVALDKNKIRLETGTLGPIWRPIMLFLADMYRYFLRFRLKKNNTKFLIEFKIMNFFIDFFFKKKRYT